MDLPTILAALNLYSSENAGDAIWTQGDAAAIDDKRPFNPDELTLVRTWIATLYSADSEGGPIRLLLSELAAEGRLNLFATDGYEVGLFGVRGGTRVVGDSFVGIDFGELADRIHITTNGEVKDYPQILVIAHELSHLAGRTDPSGKTLEPTDLQLNFASWDYYSAGNYTSDLSTSATKFEWYAATKLGLHDEMRLTYAGAFDRDGAWGQALLSGGNYAIRPDQTFDILRLGKPEPQLPFLANFFTPSLDYNDTIDLSTRIDQSRDLVFGFAGADTISTGAGDDVIYGGNDNDRIDAGVGDDGVFGGQGSDTIIGGLGSDYIDGDSVGEIRDGQFDLLTYADADFGLEVKFEIRGASGAAQTDLLIVKNIDGVTSDAAGNEYGTDRIRDIEAVFGTGFADAIILDGSTLPGDLSSVFVNLGGNARETPNSDGRISVDTLDAAAFGSALQIDLRDTRQTAETVSGPDFTPTGSFNIAFGGVRGVNGTNFADRIYGSDEADDIAGGGGNDHLFGGLGSDRLDGGKGDDFIYGGADATNADTAGYDIVEYIGIGVSLTQVSRGTVTGTWNVATGGDLGNDTLFDIQQIDSDAQTLIYRDDGWATSENTLAIRMTNETSTFIGNFGNSLGISVNIAGDRTGSALDSLTGGGLQLIGAGTDIIGSGFDDIINDDAPDGKTISAGDGNDIVSIAGATESSVIFGGSGIDQITGGAASDYIIDHGFGGQLAAELATSMWAGQSYRGYGSVDSGEGNDTIIIGNEYGSFNQSGAVNFGPLGSGYFVTPGTGDDTISLTDSSAAYYVTHRTGDGADTIFSNSESLYNAANSFTVAPRIAFDFSDYSSSAISASFDVSSYTLAEDLAEIYVVWELAGVLTINIAGGGSITIPDAIFNVNGTANQDGSLWQINDLDLTEEFASANSTRQWFIQSADTGPVALSVDTSGATQIGGPDVPPGGGGPLFSSAFAAPVAQSVAAASAPAASQSSGPQDAFFSPGDNNLTGTEGHDRLIVTWDLSSLSSTFADDILTIEDRWGLIGTTTIAGFDEIYDVASNQSYSMEEFNTLLQSQAFGDDIYGTSVDDVLTGTISSERIFGRSGEDEIDGLAGNDFIDGGFGADIMRGGAGNDRYVVDDIADQVVELAGEGTDVVETNVDYTLAANVEQLVLNGSVVAGTGNADANRITGNNAANILAGMDGDDQLFGFGGDDQLDGGDGADQLIGGGGDDTLLGGAGADLLIGGEGNDAMEGGSGNDTYYVTDAGDTVIEASGGGTDTVRLSLEDYVTPDYVERIVFTDAAIRATASAQGTEIVGNANDNILIGLAGDDILRGGLGNDQLIGGDSNDQLFGGSGSDNLQGGAGNDIIYGGLTQTTPEPIGGDGPPIPGDGPPIPGDVPPGGGIGGPIVLEDSDTIYGGAGDDLIYAQDGNDIVSGGSGNDLLDGGRGDDRLNGGLGSDAMAGGRGDDIYYVDDVNDTITENANEGIDLVLSIISLTLSENVEQLRLTGTDTIDGTGNALDNRLTGNDSANVLSGLAGDDVILGGAGDDQLLGGEGNDLLNGGTGADTLLGGLGDDIYYVDGLGDTVTESIGEGTDTVLSTISLTLGDNVEQLRMIGSDVIDGTGNALDNRLTGNDQANLMHGLAGDDIIIAGGGDDILIGGEGNDRLNGGLGADAMAGGAGDDIYYVDDLGDAVTESADDGIDIVFSTISLTLGDNVEQLRLTGSAAINGTGNALDNRLTGNEQANVLIGLLGDDLIIAGAGDDTLSGGEGNDRLNGGLGSDVMVGGVGDDIYYVDDFGDIVTENAAEGNDLVLSTINLTLGDNVEQLRLIGSDAINGTGNALDNRLTGNDQSNTISGLFGNDIIIAGGGDDILIGGEGNDCLNGGTGADSMAGGVGDDIYYADAIEDIVTENFGEGTDVVLSTVDWTLSSNVEQLRLIGSGAIDGMGNVLDNRLTGNDQSNMLDGLGGNDIIFGGAGSDVLLGSGGNDRLNGDSGADLLIGGAGADIMTGGSEGDTFEWTDSSHFTQMGAALDRVTDFNILEGDIIDLAGVDADMTMDGNQEFNFIGDTAFTGSAGELNYMQTGTNTVLRGDLDGDGQADFTIQFNGVIDMTVAAIIL